MDKELKVKVKWDCIQAGNYAVRVMIQENSLYSTLLMVSAFASAVTMVIIWSRRNVTGAVSLGCLMLATTVWSGTYALHWTNLYRPCPFFWLDLTYLGVVTVPVAFLAFALEYTNRRQLLNKVTISLFAIEPVITIILLWTDPWHGLFFAGKRTETTGSILDGGPWFWTHCIYSYSLVMIGYILLIQAYIRSPRLYRAQTRMVLLGAAITWVSNLLGLLKLHPWPNLDLTPITFTLAGMAITLALFRYRLLDIVPVARDALVENMSDGILVLDAKNRVVDVNPAVQDLMQTRASSAIGKKAEELLAAWPELAGRHWDTSEGKEEIMVTGEHNRYFDLLITPLKDQNGLLNGRLIVLRDVTGRKEAEMAVLRANEKLQRQLVEIEALQSKLYDLAIRDPLTRLFNRRYLEETLERELLKAGREKKPVSLMMIDIDHFKKFNDQYGHKAGDLILENLGRLLLRFSRGGDVACRYGGEEFLVVLPGATLQAAWERAWELCRTFESTRVKYKDFKLKATISLGIASFPDHGRTGEEIISVADNALYRAKEAGRNQVMLPDTDNTVQTR